MSTQPPATGEREPTIPKAGPANPSVEETGLSTAYRGVLAFRRDLPALLKERPGQWVAYHGDRRVGFASAPHELHQLCARQGIPEDDFIVRPIEVEPPNEIDLPYPIP
jgi:hypothetical protein